MISAVVLTHNAEATLEQTFKSLTWCDEIVLIDDNSTDKTVEIAKKYQARVFTRSLSDDFSAQRNFGLAKARGEWVVFVDSDEVVSKELVSEARLICHAGLDPASQWDSGSGAGMTQGNRRSKSPSGYFIRRNDWFLGRWLKHGETANVRLLRLARKDAGVWERPVHEVWDVKGEIGELKNPLLHYPHPNVAQFLEEINRYSSLNARCLFDQGIMVPWWHVVAYPTAKFFLNYVWLQGFRDGMPGAVMAIMMSFHSFLTRAKLWHLWRKGTI